MYEDIVRFFKLAMTLLLAFMLCAAIGELCSCSRRTLSTEDYTHTYAQDSVSITDAFTTGSKEETAWWNMDVETITYSEPDSTGAQHVVARQTIVSSGGKVIHDTIYTQLHDTIRTHARDSVIYKYKEQTKTGHTFSSYIYTFFFIVLLLVSVSIGIRYKDRITTFFHRY